MTLANIPLDVQPYLLLGYESQVKIILLVGWFIFALFYLLFWHQRLKPTKILLLGTFRASMYVTAWLYSWLFWLLYPVFKHPNVPIDSLLIFVATAYTILSSVFFVMFILNFTLWIPRFVVNFGKIDLKGFEDHAIDYWFSNMKFGKWLKKQKR